MNKDFKLRGKINSIPFNRKNIQGNKNLFKHKDHKPDEFISIKCKFHKTLQTSNPINLTPTQIHKSLIRIQWVWGKKKAAANCIKKSNFIYWLLLFICFTHKKLSAINKQIGKKMFWGVVHKWWPRWERFDASWGLKCKFLMHVIYKRPRCNKL